MSGVKDGQAGTTPVSQHARDEVDAEMNDDVRIEPMRSRKGRCAKKPAQLGMRACIESHQISKSCLRLVSSRRCPELIAVIALAFIPLMALVILHFSYPELKHHTRKFFRLSYHDPILDKYAVGADDTFIVIHWIFLLTGLRAATMTYVLIPFARWAGVKKRKARVRFAEQAWLFLYDASMFSLGMVSGRGWMPRVRMRPADQQRSTYSTMPTTGSTSARCGRPGPTGSWRAS